MMNNPWEKLGQGYYRRQDTEINAFYAKTETGEYLFIIDLEELLDKDIELSRIYRKFYNIRQVLICNYIAKKLLGDDISKYKDECDIIDKYIRTYFTKYKH